MPFFFAAPPPPSTTPPVVHALFPLPTIPNFSCRQAQAQPPTHIAVELPVIQHQTHRRPLRRARILDPRQASLRPSPSGRAAACFSRHIPSPRRPPEVSSAGPGRSSLIRRPDLPSNKQEAIQKQGCIRALRLLCVALDCVVHGALRREKSSFARHQNATSQPPAIRKPN